MIDNLESDNEKCYTILVNKNNAISKDYLNWLKDNLVKEKDVYGNNIFIVNEAYKSFEQLRKYLLIGDIDIGIDEGGAYRSLEEQQNIYEQFLNKYGKEYADKTVAAVGTSEHHTGLAIDVTLLSNDHYIDNNDDLMKNDNIFKEIHEILPKFGFTLRYPEGKEDITGYPYEPWHFRYVGKNLANNLHEHGLTLEEYYKLNMNNELNKRI
jgi:D-alanyl-D-alanine carboxypeptidase